MLERQKEQRKKMWLSQMDLGEKSDLHFTQIGRYERGECNPSSEVLKNLAEALEVSTDYLVEGGTEETAQMHIYDRDLIRLFKQVQDLAPRDKEVVKILIEAFLTRRQIEDMVRM